ncbi:MAG: response regulator [Nitrosomonas sp.]|nr:response regulator [Nitrosomonas sp.]
MAIKKILIVDDSPTERHILSRILVRKGYQTILAENGARAIAIAKETSPDLVLMDIVMPDVNGFQAIRMFLRDRALRIIPIIICSTKGQEIDKIWGMRQGAKDYIVKPIVAEELLQKITRLDTLD